MSTQTLLCGQSSLCDPLFELRSVCVTPLQKTANATFCYYYYSIKTLNAFFFLSCDNKPSSVTTNWEIVCVFFLVGCLTEVTAMSLTLDPRTCTAVFLPQEGNPCLPVWELCSACKM